MLTNYEFVKLRFQIKFFKNGHFELPSDNVAVKKTAVT